MRLETAREIKELNDARNSKIRGILFGVGLDPAIKAATAEATMEDRYAQLVSNLYEAAIFNRDVNNSVWLVSRAVLIAETDDGSTPKLMLRFRMSTPPDTYEPDIVVAEWFDAPPTGVLPLDSPLLGFAGMGQLLAQEYVYRAELPEDSPYRTSVLPGEDPRNVDVRMYMLETSANQFFMSLAADQFGASTG
jgi:hypothetical protein